MSPHQRIFIASASTIAHRAPVPAYDGRDLYIRQQKAVRLLGMFRKYFAYKSSDCFFVRLKNGRQYMLGCANPQSMVDYIENRIRQ